MKLLSIILFALLLSSCQSSHILSQLSPAKQEVAIRQTNGETRDAEWERVIRLFADHDIPIKMVDKGSGFIESEAMSFVNAYAIDGQQDYLSNNPVYVVAQREVYGKTLIQPSYITGQVKIFVLPNNGKTELQVSIENLRNFYTVAHRYSHSSTVNYDEYQLQVSSTGLLESNIADYITSKTDSVNIALLKGVVINPSENRTALYAKSENRSGIAIAIPGGIIGVAAIAAVAIYAPKQPH